jgi:hypothetical protein
VKVILYISVIALMIVASCDSPQDPNRAGDKLDGYIFFKDTNITTLHGYYSVSIYDANYSDPFNKIPIKTDSLTGLYVENVHYQAMYSMNGIPAGKIFVAVTWSRYPKVQNEIPMVLGTYGCDTNYYCTSHKVIEYPNYQGQFRNIWAWTDTTKKLN